MGKAFATCMDNFRRWFASPKIYVVFILILIMQDSMMIAPIRRFARDMNLGIAPWIYPFLPMDWYICMLEAVGAIFLFCDSPMVNAGTPYLFVRTGRRAWLGGQILYVLLAALAYQILFLLSSVLLVLPQLEFTPHWGKTLGSLAQSNIGYWEYGITLSGSLVRRFTPMQAMALSFSLRWMVTALLGMLLLCMNLFLPRVFGMIAGGAIALLHPTAINASGTFLYYISPASWTALDYVNVSGGSDTSAMALFPDLTYIRITGMAILLALILISFLGFRKKSIYSLSTT